MNVVVILDLMDKIEKTIALPNGEYEDLVDEFFESYDEKGNKLNFKFWQNQFNKFLDKEGFHEQYF